MTVSQKDIKVQSFTRVNFMTQVNDGLSLVMVYEFEDQPALALNMPVATFLNLFQQMPKIFSESKKFRLQQGKDGQIQDDSLMKLSPWAVQKLALRHADKGQVLEVQLDGCSLELAVDATLIGGLVLPRPAPTKVVKKTVKKPIEKPDQKVSVPKRKTASAKATKLIPTKVDRKTAVKTKKVKSS
jgi:hypothetical protein